MTRLSLLSRLATIRRLLLLAQAGLAETEAETETETQVEAEAEAEAEAISQVGLDRIPDGRARNWLREGAATLWIGREKPARF